ncbi:hypothetical protein AB4059_12310 [Lysobacter sp. 2RAF19]
MTKLIVAMAIVLLAASCVQTPQAPNSAGPFVGLDLPKLPEGDRRIITEASEDFRAVVEGKKPVHAVFDKDAPLPADGGTTFYQGKGYRLTILISLSDFGEVHGTAYGPVVEFERAFAPGNTSEISDIRVYSPEAFGKLMRD